MPSEFTTVRGKPLVGVGFERDYSPSTGYTSTFIFEGTKDAIEALSFRLSGVQHHVDHTNPPVSRLTYTLNGAGETPDPNAILEVQYELLANTSQKSIYEHRRSIALNTSDSTIIDVIKTAVRNNTTASQTLSLEAQKLYTHAKLGQDSFIQSQFVFRITQIINRAAVVAIAYSRLNRIYSNTQLIAETNPTALYSTAIASAYSAVYEDNYNSDVPSGYTLGWLKQAPTITSVAGGKSAVSVEYWLEAWSNFLYSNAD